MARLTDDEVAALGYEDAIARLVHPEDPTHVTDALTTAMADGRRFGYEARTIHDDGSTLLPQVRLEELPRSLVDALIPEARDDDIAILVARVATGR